MEIQLSKLKNNFANIMSIRNNTKNVFDILELRINKLKSTHAELIKNNKSQIFVFGLDSFHFQSKLIDIEYDDMKRIFLAINNRTYCEYFKLYKLIVEYIFQTINDKKITELIKLNKFPIYKDLEPFKEYRIETIMDVHENIIILITSILSIINTKENELQIYKNKKELGLSLDNFVNSFNFNIIIMKEKVKLFLMYIDFFHKLHTKYLKRFNNKIQLMYTHITNDIKFDDFVNLDTKKKKEIIDDFDTTKMDKDLLNDLKNSIHIDSTESNISNEQISISSLDAFSFDIDNNTESMLITSARNNFKKGVDKVISLNNIIKNFKDIKKTISDEEINIVFKNIDQTCEMMMNENIMDQLESDTKQLASEKDESKIVPFIETNINQNNTLIHNNTLTPIIEENLENYDEVSQQKINNDCKKEEQKKKRGRKKKTN